MFADSVQKLLELWKMCDELDVDTGPAMLSPNCTVVPLDAWYSYTFDHWDPRPGSTLFDKFCKWPMHYDNVRQERPHTGEAAFSHVALRCVRALRHVRRCLVHRLPDSHVPSRMWAGVGVYDRDQ